MTRKVKWVTDLATMKALAHDLRVRMLGELRSHGEATASELARKFGESSGSTSYHLRELAKYGFVEEAPVQPNRRERRWRAAHELTAWNNADFAGTDEGREVIAFMQNRQWEALREAAAEFDRGRASWSDAWIETAGVSDYSVRMAPDTLQELWERIQSLIDELEARDAGRPDAVRVTLGAMAFPRERKAAAPADEAEG
ncbi:ArsR/SmtB family transcription factor [Rhizohabitans arisaemae]|uniref:ArsR/SmtB family transcription factor n=1 Tax=Rhizohabitans arisaemae TaxID=2720610 RepID=UPI0024B19B65|nr:helix-turn-helix domain-containing protein [Rhizohabitans arisaemae]